MDVVVLNCLAASLIYAVAASLSKQALSEGFGTLRLCFLVNLIFVVALALL